MAHRNMKQASRRDSTTTEQAKGVEVCGQPSSTLLTAWEPNQPITIRLKQFLKLTGIARSTAFKMWDPRSCRYDEKMPVGFKLFDSPNAPRFFFYDEVVAWLMYRAEQSRSNRAGKKGVLEA